MHRLNRSVGWVVLLTLLLAGSLPTCTFAASAARLGRPISAYSASLFGQTSLTALQTQTLACDPDEPLFGTTSVGYDVGVVRVTGFGYAPGYMLLESPYPSGAGIEVLVDGVPVMRDLAAYVEGGIARLSEEPPTGYLQLYWARDESATPGHYVPPNEQFIGFNSAFTDGVDTHFFTFEYLSGVPNEIPAAYRVFDSLARGSGNQADIMAFGDPNNPHFTQPGEIIDAVISGTAVPEPSAGILALVGIGLSSLVRRRRRPSELLEIRC
jgi:hypothetical protein